MWSPSVPLPSERLKPLLGWETAKPLCGSLNQNSSQYAPHSITGMLPCQQERFFMSLKYNEDQWLLPWFIKLPLCTPCEVFIFHCDPELCSFFPPAAGKTCLLSLGFIHKPTTKKEKTKREHWVKSSLFLPVPDFKSCFGNYSPKGKWWCFHLTVFTFDDQVMLL